MDILIAFPCRAFLAEQRQNPRVAQGDVRGLIDTFVVFFAKLFLGSAALSKGGHW